MAPTQNIIIEGQQNPYWSLGEEEEEEASSFALSLQTDSVKFAVLKAVVDLDIFEIIKKCGPGGRLSTTEIAAKLPAKKPEAAGPMIGRLLDFLVSHSILTVAPVTLLDGSVERRYGLAPVCKFLTANEDGASLAPFTDGALYKSMLESS